MNNRNDLRAEKLRQEPSAPGSDLPGQVREKVVVPENNTCKETGHAAVVIQKPVARRVKEGGTELYPPPGTGLAQIRIPIVFRNPDGRDEFRSIPIRRT